MYYLCLVREKGPQTPKLSNWLDFGVFDVGGDRTHNQIYGYYKTPLPFFPN